MAKVQTEAIATHLPVFTVLIVHPSARQYLGLLQPYRPKSAAVALMGALCLAACSPAHNWRSVGIEGTSVKALMPCKPDRAEREVPLLGPAQPTLTLRMMSCDVGPRTFAVSAVQVPANGSAKTLQDHWQRAAWAALKQPLPDGQPAPAGWSVQPIRLRDGVSAQRWSGPALNHQQQSIRAHVQWQHENGWLVQSAVYGPEPDGTVIESFLGGLDRR